jgi:iron complex outermembrane receptor protein
VWLDGARINDEVAGVADLATVPLWLVDSVTLYRGSAPFEWDDGALGGTLRFELRRPKRSEGALGVLFGTQSTRGVSAFVAERRGAYSVLLGGQLLGASEGYAFADDRGTLFDDADDRTSHRPNADVTQADGWLVLRHESGRGSTEFILNVAEREQPVPKLAVTPARRARADLGRVLGSLVSRTRLGAKRAALFEARTTFVGTTTTFADPARELALRVTDLEQRGARAEQALLLRLPVGATLHSLYGVRLHADRLRRDEAGVRASDASETNARAALGLEWRPRAHWSTRATVGFDCRDAGERCAASEPTGRLSAQLGNAAVQAFVTGARGVRFPTLGERHGVSLLVRGNPELAAESGYLAELGLRTQWLEARRNSRRASLELVGFERWSRDLVSYVRSAQGYLVPVNLDRTRVRGLEFTGMLAPTYPIRLELRATALDPKRTTSGDGVRNDVLPFVSRLVVAPSMGVDSGPLARAQLSRARAMLRFLYLSSRYADAAGLAVLPSQRELEVEVELWALRERLRIDARGTSTLAAPRFDAVGFPLPERSAFVNLEVRW